MSMVIAWIDMRMNRSILRIPITYTCILSTLRTLQSEPMPVPRRPDRPPSAIGEIFKHGSSFRVIDENCHVPEEDDKKSGCDVELM